MFNPDKPVRLRKTWAANNEIQAPILKQQISNKFQIKITKSQKGQKPTVASYFSQIGDLVCPFFTMIRLGILSLTIVI